MDVLSLRKHGVSGVVATLGTALTDEQAKLAKKYAPEIWVSYDGDSAGQKAILRALDIFDAQGIKARVLNFPGGMDPDDYIKANGIEGFSSLKPLQPIEYRMLMIEQALDMSTEDGRTQYAMECCELLKRIKSPVERENYLSRLVLKTGFQRNVLVAQIGVMEAQTEKQPRPRRTERDRQVGEIKDFVTAERTLIMLLGNGAIPKDAISEDDFETPLYAEMARALILGASAASVLEKISDERRRDAASALNEEVLPDEKDALTIAEDCLRIIRRYRIEKTIDKLKGELSLATAGDKQELMRKLMELSKEQQRLKTGRKE